MGVHLLALRGGTGRLLEIKSRPRGSQRGCKREHRPGAWPLSGFLAGSHGVWSHTDLSHKKRVARQSPDNEGASYQSAYECSPQAVGNVFASSGGRRVVVEVGTRMVACPCSRNFRTALPPSPQWETKRKEGNSEDGRKESFQEHH